eukprot:1344345-Amorphochlora_amoeboformis.AAC.1
MSGSVTSFPVSCFIAFSLGTIRISLNATVGEGLRRHVIRCKSHLHAVKGSNTQVGHRVKHPSGILHEPRFNYLYDLVQMIHCCTI